MSKHCKVCVKNNNRDENCEVCDCFKKNYFRPIESVEKYFPYSNVGYSWNSSSELLTPTTTIKVAGERVCPYCAEKPLPIQSRIRKYEDYSNTGYMCVCEGALKEIEFKEKLAELQKKHYEELEELKKSYRNDLVYNSDKLLNLEYALKKKEIDGNRDSYFKESYFYNDRNE